MRIRFGALVQSTLSAILVFLLIDSAVEYVSFKITGFALLPFLEQTIKMNYGFRFHAVNVVLFSVEMLVVILFYAILRPSFKTCWKPVILCTCLFLLFFLLFLGQMVNIGIYPLKAALMVGLSTVIGFPAAVVAGSSMYDKVSGLSKGN